MKALLNSFQLNGHRLQMYNFIPFHSKIMIFRKKYAAIIENTNIAFVEKNNVSSFVRAAFIEKQTVGIGMNFFSKKILLFPFLQNSPE